MGKVVDITEKLSFEGNPCIKIKDVKLETNADAATVLKIMGMIGEGGEMTTKAIADMCELIFTKEAQKELAKLKLNFEDYSKVVNCAIDLITGNEEGDESGE